MARRGGLSEDRSAARRGTNSEQGRARRGREGAARRGGRWEEGRARQGGEGAARRRVWRGREGAERRERAASRGKSGKHVIVVRMIFSRDVFARLHKVQATFVVWLPCCNSLVEIYTNIRH